MRVAEYDRYGGPEVVHVTERPLPEPQRGQVLVRVHAAALNPKDVLTRSGRFWFVSGLRFPRRMGYDWAGEAVALGAGVTEIVVGQRLFGMIQAWSGGSCAEYLTANVGELAPMPNGLSWAEAAALPLTALTALQALRDEARLKVGQRVLINGASGGVGVCAIQIAKALGARVTTLTSASNLALARSLGADEALDYAQASLAADGPYDVFFDVFGNRSLQAVRPVLSTQGTYVTTVPSPRAFAMHVLRNHTRQRGRLVVVHSKRRDLEVLRDWAEQGKLRSVIAQRYTLETLADAQRALASKRTRGKLVVELGV